MRATILILPRPLLYLGDATGLTALMSYGGLISSDSDHDQRLLSARPYAR